MFDVKVDRTDPALLHDQVAADIRRAIAEGLLEFRRGRGITVSGGAVARSIVLDKAHDLVEVARSQGIRRDELLQLIEGLA
jgi:GntR family transcriptional regulator